MMSIGGPAKRFCGQVGCKLSWAPSRPRAAVGPSERACAPRKAVAARAAGSAAALRERGSYLDALAARLRRREADPACPAWVSQLRSAVLQLSHAAAAEGSSAGVPSVDARHVARLRDVVVRKLQRASAVADTDLAATLRAAEMALQAEKSADASQTRGRIRRPPAAESTQDLWQADDEWLTHATDRRLSTGLQRWTESVGDDLCRLQVAEAKLRKLREETLLPPHLRVAWLDLTAVHLEVREALEAAEDVVRQALTTLDWRLASFTEAAITRQMPREAWIARVELMRQHAALRRADLDRLLRPKK